MSTTLDNFAAVDDEKCPHGNRDLDEDVMYCWYCWRAEQGGMAIDDPTRGDGE